MSFDYYLLRDKQASSLNYDKYEFPLDFASQCEFLTEFLLRNTILWIRLTFSGRQRLDIFRKEIGIYATIENNAEKFFCTIIGNVSKKSTKQ